ncbi:MAG TPA: hypothetical protein VGD81_14670 [Opitutaceae bacterium]
MAFAAGEAAFAAAARLRAAVTAGLATLEVAAVAATATATTPAPAFAVEGTLAPMLWALTGRRGRFRRGAAKQALEPADEATGLLRGFGDRRGGRFRLERAGFARRARLALRLLTAFA